jgi:hypothetical protein
VLKHGLFPLAEALSLLLEIGEWGMSAPVEIEFAVDLRARELACLQMRPLVLWRENEEVAIGEVEPSRLLCRSSHVLGHGRLETLRDVVVVDFLSFDRARSHEVAQEVARLNVALQNESRPYLLVGVGRWGSKDRWLGIPVTWDQISGARVIVESGFRDLQVTPSQGSHFFQNLNTFGIGYFTVNPDVGDGFVDWDWLRTQPPAEQTDCVRWLRLGTPLSVTMNGRLGQGVILKPA